MKRFYYGDSIPVFLTTSTDEILGKLIRFHDFEVDEFQKNAWIKQIDNLKQQLGNMKKGHVFFEFSIPRMGKRVDNILLIDNIVFVLEYKVGADQHARYAIDQVIDYALDLKNFHEGSHEKYIVPILVSTKADERENDISWSEDKIANPLFCNDSNLAFVIEKVLENQENNEHGGHDTQDWTESGYKPTPTIVEAAQALYQGHAVEEISRSDAGAQNLTVTSDCIAEIIKYSKENKRKSICFVTGVPGAGKTLAGLNIANQEFDTVLNEHAVFLSGNGPLVIVLREALARDEAARTGISKQEAARKVNAFIQNIHHFRDEGLKSDKAPNEHVVIFDEAQRAWNQAHAEKFMIRKRGAEEFNMSEPEFLISLMDRRGDWSVIICLIGGGQEINTGEAGLVEWFNALEKNFQHWDIYHSGQLSDKNYSWGQDLQMKLGVLNAQEKQDLHLATSIRSFRAEKLSEFVEAIIDGNDALAVQIFSKLGKYPIAITRNMDTAHAWLTKHARGNERYGKITSSGAARLKAEGIYVKNEIQAAYWFLNDKDDVRSSYYLEDVATEFDIQGLELDWTCICWGADFRMQNQQWNYYKFKGTKWQTINDQYKRVYLANAYRVLLTRARQGMVIFIPHGDDSDYTRLKEFYDGTYQFLKRCGIKDIE